MRRQRDSNDELATRSHAVSHRHEAARLDGSKTEGDETRSRLVSTTVHRCTLHQWIHAKNNPQATFVFRTRHVTTNDPRQQERSARRLWRQ